MKRTDYVVFILTHGRADHIITYKMLCQQGYTGRVVFVIDDEDEQAELYKKNFGEDNIFVFSKDKEAQEMDEVLKGNKKAIVYARNACFWIAEKLGYKYFIELDDDYTAFGYLFDNNMKYLPNHRHSIKSLDDIFSAMVTFIEKTPVLSLAMLQGGDLIGGRQNNLASACKTKRKAMNSFVCSTDKPFKFIGRINEDVNAYASLQHKGQGIFLTTTQVMLIQLTTQSNKGGMTDLYLDSGTYLKSFFSVIVNPSACKVRLMGGGGNGVCHYRLHHKVSFNHCAPKILAQEYKK